MKSLKFLKLMPAATLIAMLSLGSNPALAQEEIYRWVDAEGVTHFSARPPEGVEYQRITTRNNVVDTVAPRTVGETEDMGSDNGNDGGMAALPEVDAQEPDPEMVAERCEQARSNLSWMTQRVQIQRENESGEIERLSEDERQRMIEEAQAFIDEWC